MDCGEDGGDEGGEEGGECTWAAYETEKSRRLNRFAKADENDPDPDPDPTKDGGGGAEIEREGMEGVELLRLRTREDGETTEVEVLAMGVRWTQLRALVKAENSVNEAWMDERTWEVPNSSTMTQSCGEGDGERRTRARRRTNHWVDGWMILIPDDATSGA